MSITFAGPTVSGNLADHLHRHAATMPDKAAFIFLADGEEIESTLTYSELYRRAQVVARTLATAGLSGKAVVLFHPPGREFIIAFCGCLMAGVTAVPLQPPTTRRLLDRAQALFADCSAAAVLTTTTGTTGVEPLVIARGLPLIATDQIDDGHGPCTLPEVPASGVAVLQYTSGSTGSPKGVIITQGNLVSNSTMIGHAFRIRSNDVFVNWLPLLHDMGLIGHVVQIIHHGITCVHLSPQAMIRKPLRWLRAIARFGATISGGPDFAWRLLTERVQAEDLVGIDLSHWRLAFSGAEPVRISTLERVAALLAPTGFLNAAFLPCYGMAEATLIISGGPGSGVPSVSRPNNAAADSTPYVGCGQPVAGCSVAIVDPEAMVQQPDGCVGEVWAHGTHVAAGYWGDPERTALTFHARLPGDTRHWLRTGDLGFMRHGQLHLSGRIKDLLIINGKKHHPEDVEATIQTQVVACASGIAAAFQAEVDGRSALVIAIEMAERPADQAARTKLTGAISHAVWAHHELVVDTVAVVRTGRLPRTTSGKVRRGETRSLWASGALTSRDDHV